MCGCLFWLNYFYNKKPAQTAIQVGTFELQGMKITTGEFISAQRCIPSVAFILNAYALKMIFFLLCCTNSNRQPKKLWEFHCAECLLSTSIHSELVHSIIDTNFWEVHEVKQDINMQALIYWGHEKHPCKALSCLRNQPIQLCESVSPSVQVIP